MANHITRRENIDPFVPMERLFNSFFREPIVNGINTFAGVEEGSLALDVSDSGEEIVVRASLPGFAREDVNIEVHDGVLNISASRESTSEETGEKFYRRERSFGSVSRRVALPVAVQDDQASAELKDGVLTLRLPKATSARPKKISIN